MSDTYHHGNLRQALIEAGIRIINEQGEEALSLRKVAAACEVSHAAPYAHFKDKEELLAAMKSSVTGQFTAKLEQAVEGADGASAAGAEQKILAMGRAYISFFSHNPDYFTFLFGKQKLVAHLRMDEDHEEDYPPFKLLKTVFRQYLKESGRAISPAEQEVGLIKIWSSVHGMAALACMAGVETTIDWEQIELQ
ncbi:MAG: TetR/AcrR family transcriptional regulator, partial [Firmicutes bacterium]|nr:TetR/AcrR family transcriptional regulator [Bacillota bacterium]